MARSDQTPVFETVTNAQAARFYRLLGPLLARREVHKSLGGVPWDDDGKTWIVALDGKEVTGFIGVTKAGSVESLYTRPGRSGLRAQLVAAAVDTAGDRALHATVSHSRTPAYTAAGFKVDSQTVNFAKVHRPANGAKA
ncbi:hypothetical protein [Streptomyces lydicus]|uniref:hypothetical protein n=1 Tax=Streptomyces lydicus TaxID=47763 RepID=UPI001010452C|nr:hypothetical protein [Streptomyces lydicus]MCZ1012257.1 hypothetical protein [Streptomyces lydicus]